MEQAELPSQQLKKTPKVWNIEDHEFVYAPKKPDGDPWAALIASRREKDKAKCDGWKEEVQNLLIFAGLFSAVVTAFVIESYKTLQPDPNDAIVGLLSHIVVRLDNPLNGTAAGTSSIPIQAFPTFTPTPSSIRINVFWFLSLILSLSTVLVGIVTLQWLREYQSYAGFNPKETCAVFQMRSEGMEKWYVWKIFTALPLLLQAALVLFFGGIIDFLLALENKVAIPIAVVIGLTLLFLVATTVLPTFQGLFLYFPFLFFRDLSKEPSQCAYKSPQSHAFRTLSTFSFTLFHHLFPMLRHTCQYLITSFVVNAVTNALGPNSDPDHEIESVNSSLAPEDDDIEDRVGSRLLTTWKTKTWRDFDSEWLCLRDTFVRGIKYDQGRLVDHLRHLGETLSPVFDSFQAIEEAAGDPYTDTSRSSAIYHTFSALSQSVVQLKDRRESRYFHSLWRNTPRQHRYIDLGYDGFLSRPPDRLLHCQNILSFNAGRFITTFHAAELRILISGKLWANDITLPESLRDTGLPHYLIFQGWELGDKLLSWQYSHVLMSFFKYAATEDQNIGPRSLRGYPEVVEFLKDAAERTVGVLNSVPNDPVGDDGFCSPPGAFQAILAYIGAQLHQSLSMISFSPDDNIQPEMSYLFYTSALYVRPLTKFWFRISTPSSILDDCIDALLLVMRQYKQKTGGVNRLLEDRLEGEDGFRLGEDVFKGGVLYRPVYELVERFTDEWWSFLDDGILPAVPESRASSPPESHPEHERLADLHSSGPDPSNDNADQIVDPSTANDALISVEYPDSQSQSQSQS